MEWEPFATNFEFQSTLAGRELEATSALSTKKSTRLTPTLSAATAVIETVSATVEPGKGEVILTIGAVVSGGGEPALSEILIIARHCGESR